MNKIIFDLNHEFDIVAYSRNTTIDDGVVRSYANVSFSDTNAYDELIMLSRNPISDIIISNNGTSVYHITNQCAYIVSIYENVTMDGEIGLSISIRFDEKVEEETE